ncbi:hypothetical protein [Tahibacter aquaticus]|uniref:hypothetical protein n=1 Tax=Tahibacter aquaticus TaxID=520092 RepID=UPI001061567C|nr:hypothetical protein [Tahibacter aquaticus]
MHDNMPLAGIDAFARIQLRQWRRLGRGESAQQPRARYGDGGQSCGGNPDRRVFSGTGQPAGLRQTQFQGSTLARRKRADSCMRTMPALPLASPNRQRRNRLAQ